MAKSNKMQSDQQDGEAKALPRAQDGAEKPEASQDEADFLQTARERYEAAYAREEQNILEAYEDLRFRAGEQWDPEDERDRQAEGRPCMTINMMGQFIRQITGDIRQMRPAIKAVPVDARGDPDTADTIGGLLRYIENRSVAKAAYFSGADSQVTCGIGHWRVVTEYADDSTFNQEIGIEPIEDQVMVLWDPDARKQDRSDAMFCFVPVDMSRMAFKERHPEAADAAPPGPDESSVFQDWYSEDHVRACEYWYKRPIERTLFLLPDGSIDDLTGLEPADLAAAEQALKGMLAQGLSARIEKRPGHQVCRALISYGDILEPEIEWPGRHIPIVRCQGEEIRIGRKTVRHGAVRFARDPQRRYNVFISAQTEAVGLQPKAPFIGTQTQFQKYYDQWDAANSSTRPFLEYTPDPLAPGAPQRVQPPVNSAGITEAITLAHSDMQATTGIYNASLGAESNEVSGKAIRARQTEGDTGSFVYVENFAQAVCRTGQIIVDLIPHIYDTQRTVRIAGADGQEQTVEINQPTGAEIEGEPAPALNDVTVGAYDVVMEMGPSYSTKREEARDGMTELLKSAPPEIQAALLPGYVKLLDWPNAQDVADIVTLLAPPQVQQALAAKTGQPPPPPPPPTPQQQAEMAAQQRQQELDGLKHQVEIGKLQAEQSRTQVEGQKAQVDMAKVQQEMRALEANIAVAQGKAPAGGDDPRVAALGQAVGEIQQVITQMLAGLQQLERGGMAPPANANGPAAGGGAAMSGDRGLDASQLPDTPQAAPGLPGAPQGAPEAA